MTAVGRRRTRVIWADRATTAVLWGIALFVVAILLAIIGHFLLASIGTFLSQRWR